MTALFGLLMVFAGMGIAKLLKRESKDVREE